MSTQEEASALLATLPHVDVMLAHCPPFGVNDDPSDNSHTGFIGLREYVEREKPRYLLHGHTYPNPGSEVTHLNETKIVYVFGEKIIEI
jgi:Icc-related predicted phosphoesterase